MNSGSMRHTVDIVGFRSQVDGAFQDVPVPYIVCKSVPCSIEAVTGSEVRRGKQMTSETTVLVMMHHPQTSFHVNSTMQLREMYGKDVHRTIHIVAAYDPDGRNRVLQIEGREDG